MPVTADDVRYLRQLAIDAHAVWKQEIALCDLIASDDWEILWPDLSVESSKPLVENLYGQALEDKTLTAGAIPPDLYTQPTRGTRKDQGEKNAEKRRRIGMSYWERSDLRRNLKKFYRDELHTGVAAGSPWAKGFSGPDQLPSNQRFAYFQKVDPRHLFPLGWDNRGRLTAGLVMRQRRIQDLRADWGADHPSLMSAEIRHTTAERQLYWLEEIWYFDQTTWGVAIGDANLPTNFQGMPFGPNSASGGMVVDWIVPPSPHMLGSCPLKAVSRISHNDSPRGALLDIVPQLRVAQNFMARLLDDMQASMYAPVVLDNIKNPHEYGVGAILIGNGQGQAHIDRDRPPVNFEAQQTVRQIMEQARRQAFEPMQRSGEAGASIISGKGTTSLMGSFNAELAAGQYDVEILLADLTSVTAALDERWCAGLKQVWVPDHTNMILSDEEYDPAKLFKGDHRFMVSYGDRTGLDDQQHLIRISTIKNLDGMSLRTFMQKAGVSLDVLAEETDMAIEKLVSIFTDVLLPQQIQAGDKTALVKFIEKIDDDKKTVREAVFETIKEAEVAAAQGPQSPGSPGGRADILRMARSLQSGGIPGSAAGQPPSQLGGPPAPGASPEIQRALASIGPSGPGGP